MAATLHGKPQLTKRLAACTLRLDPTERDTLIDLLRIAQQSCLDAADTLPCKQSPMVHAFLAHASRAATLLERIEGS